MSAANSSIKPLKINNLLASNPSASPQFTSTIKNASGESVELADPKATMYHTGMTMKN